MKSKAAKAKSKSAPAAKLQRASPRRDEGPARVKPGNPLLARWSAAFGLPPFKKIEPAHFKAAFAAALKEHKAEIARIAGETAKPTFDNTIVALEKSGRLLDKVAAVFYNLAGAHTNDALQAIERDMAPKLAAHETAMMLNAKHFHARRGSLRAPRRARSHRRAAARPGAALQVARSRRRQARRQAEDARRRDQPAAGDAGDAVLAERLEGRAVLAPGAARSATSTACPKRCAKPPPRVAADQGLDGKYVITLSRSSIEPFLQFSARRDLREEAFNAWIRRGEMGKETDNRAIMAEIVALRAEFAALLGFKTYADYSLEETMAKTPASVRGLLIGGVGAGRQARHRRARCAAAAGARGGRQLRHRARGTGATTPRRSARRASTSTRRRRART